MKLLALLLLFLVNGAQEKSIGVSSHRACSHCFVCHSVADLAEHRLPVVRPRELLATD